jgi:hypothetical protein
MITTVVENLFHPGNATEDLRARSDRFASASLKKQVHVLQECPRVLILGSMIRIAVHDHLFFKEAPNSSLLTRPAEQCKARAILKILQNKTLSRQRSFDFSAFAETSAIL